MKLARLTLLSLAFFFLFGLISQAEHGPLVGVVTDPHDFTPYELDHVAYLFDVRARRSYLQIDFRYEHQRSRRSRHSRHPRYRRFSNRFYRDDYGPRWDYTVRLDARKGYINRCGRYSRHYDWYVVDEYRRVINRGHAHEVDRVARDVVRVIYGDWR
ncbi:MAG TPA: hypothetical protein VLV83_17485 [Acidobacteriota bacterium]|nr:hypothetical protein [Acidobacteriota bacterium]